MRIYWFDFSSAVKTRASAWLLAILLPGLAFAAESDTKVLPDLEIREPVTRAPDVLPQIGDRLILQFEIDANLIQPGQQVLLRPLDPKPSLEDLGWFLDSRPTNQLGMIRFVISPLKGGELTLPPLLVSLEGGADFARTRPFTLRIQDLEVKPDEKPELLDVLPVRLPWGYVVLALLGCISLLLIAWSLYRRHLKRQPPRKTPEPPPLPSEPPHVAARRRIETLFDTHDFTRESLKRVSFGVSEILKEFLSIRFDIDARESTSDELLSLLRKQGLDRGDLVEIRNLFEVLDQFKFLNLESFPESSPEQQLEIRLHAFHVIDRWALKTALPEAAP